MWIIEIKLYNKLNTVCALSAEKAVTRLDQEIHLPSAINVILVFFMYYNSIYFLYCILILVSFNHFSCHISNLIFLNISFSFYFYLFQLLQTYFISVSCQGLLISNVHFVSFLKFVFIKCLFLYFSFISYNAIFLKII